MRNSSEEFLLQLQAAFYDGRPLIFIRNWSEQLHLPIRDLGIKVDRDVEYLTCEIAGSKFEKYYMDVCGPVDGDYQSASCSIFHTKDVVPKDKEWGIVPCVLRGKRRKLLMEFLLVVMPLGFWRSLRKRERGDG